jgi:hypothetical protein
MKEEDEVEGFCSIEKQKISYEDEQEQAKI